MVRCIFAYFWKNLAYYTILCDNTMTEFIMKRIIIFLLWVLFIPSVFASVKPDSIKVYEYFNEIKNNESLLNQFFMYMPKGGDIHNHLTGSVYAETYFKLAVEDRLWLDMETGKLYPTQLAAQKAGVASPVQLTASMNNLNNIRRRLLDLWSISKFKAFHSVLKAGNDFFNAFDLFLAAAGKHLVELLQELKHRAAIENVQYLEIMAMSPRIGMDEIDRFFGEGTYERENKILEKNIVGKKTSLTHSLELIYNQWEKSEDMAKIVKDYVHLMDSIDVNSNLVDIPNAPICLYQTYAVRNADPLRVFAQLYLSFKACMDESNTCFVGVNIISPEDGDLSMKDYRGHMEMFGFLKKKALKPVKLSIHAGELTMGLVKPEELGSHIRDAVYIANADRIGHGTDIVFERESVSLIEDLKRRNIPIEINLSSNEAVLGLRENNHPFPIYFKAGVPLVISTDDAGVLRTNLSEQYTLLTLRYGLSYYEIKKLVRNSITYSFASDEIKKILLNKLEVEFHRFEARWVDNIAIMKQWDG
ncbi:MAG: putative adenosine deaminase [Bacteroidetes bacterium]|nr:putative adenosine deaminase [Bacteroidota bacterium]